MFGRVCWGLWDNRWEYNGVSVDLKPFLDDLRRGQRWYAEPHMKCTIQEGSQEILVSGTFRHVNCIRVSSSPQGFPNFRCEACSSIPKERDFCMRVYRSKISKFKRGNRNSGGGRRLGYFGVSEIMRVAQTSKLDVRALRSELWRVKATVATLSVRVKCLRESSIEFCNRGDLKSFCRNIVHAHKMGKFEGKESLWDFLTDIVKNVGKEDPRGKRYSEATKVMFETIKLWGGPRLHHFLSLNMGGPSLDTTKRDTRKALKYKVGENEGVFQHLAVVYKSAMNLASIPLGTVPTMLAEDETVVKRSVRWVARDDVLLGFCGPIDNHNCISDYIVEVGSGVTGYESIVNSFKSNVRAHYARVLIVNPLHARLPRLVAVIQLTCNRFDSKDVQNQWEKVRVLWSKHLSAVLGPLIGHSSDGDARRRKLMLEDFTSSRGNWFRVPWDGWYFSARILHNNDVYGLHDQDFVHNGKKLVNPLDLPSRHLILGNENATLNHIYLVYHSFSVDRHGLQEGDIKREDRQNWTAAQRLASRKVQLCLQQLKQNPTIGRRELKVQSCIYKLLRHI